MGTKTWQESVMDEEGRRGCSLVGKYPFEDVEDVIKETSLHQAELTFPDGEKQGYEKGLKEQGTPLADAEIRLANKEYAASYRKAWAEQEVEIISFKVGEKQGIRKVVEWLKHENGIYYHEAVYKDIEAQLKDWGIE